MNPNLNGKLKRGISLLLTVLVLLGMLPATVLASNETANPSVDYSLEYDDRIAIDGAVSVTEGDVVVAFADGILTAKGIGTTTISVDGIEKTVSVSPAKVYLVLVDGQSNAAGAAGEMNGVLPILPEVGYGYIWANDTLADMNTNVSATLEGKTSSVGFHTAFAAEWVKMTGEKVVMIHKGTNGRPIQDWASVDGETATRTTNAVKAIEDCINVLNNSENYEIVRAGYYWLQGESNMDIKSSGTHIQYTTADEYETAYMAMHDAFIAALKKSGVEDCRGGILTVRRIVPGTSDAAAELGYCSVRAAQQNLANQNSDIFMASTVTDSWLKYDTSPYTYSTSSGTSVSVDKIWGELINTSNYGHYFQAAYNILGLEAAENTYKAYADTVGATSFNLMGAGGTKTYADGSDIYYDENMYEVGTNNPDEETAAQLTVVPYPRYANCGSVTMVLRDKYGQLVSDLIGDNGYIPDVTKLSDDMELTVTCGEMTKTFVVNPTPIGYFWDFTNPDAVSGNVVSADTTDRRWSENDLTYSATSVTLTESGIDNSTYKGYFTMDSEITLSQTEPWTIEWKGSCNNALIMSAAAGGANGTYIYANDYKSAAKMDLVKKGSASATGALIADIAAPDDIRNNADVVWYIVHDGYGNITMAYVDGETTVYETTANALDVDVKIGCLLGQYSNGSLPCDGTMKYIKIYNMACIFGEQEIALEAPVVLNKPQTTVSGNGYTGTITWTTTDSVFVAGKSYTAKVSLQTEDGFLFDKSVAANVYGGTVSDLVVTEDLMTFAVTFPTTAARPDYFWDFTNTDAVNNSNVVSAVTGDGWAENNLTYSKSSVTLSASGLTNAAAHFEMEHPVTLLQSEPWTIEWKGGYSKAGILMSGDDGGIASPYIYTDPTYVRFVKSGNVASAKRYGAMESISSEITNNLDTTWYITHDGFGNVTVAYSLDGATVSEITSGKLDQDIKLSRLLGTYYESGTGVDQHAYTGTIQYIKIYNSAVIVGEQAVDVSVPVTGMKPQTTISGINFDGEVSWEPGVNNVFAEQTVYVANVELTANDGFIFSNTVTVAGVADIAISADGKTLTFSKEYDTTGEARLKGDITGDGKVNVLDVNKLFGYVNGKVTLADEVLVSADLNGDGKVNVLDVNKLFKFVNGQIDSL